MAEKCLASRGRFRSPVGKSVIIYVDESESDRLRGKSICGKIISLGNAEKATIKLDEQSRSHLDDAEFLDLHTRHTGYYLYHLAVGGIGVTLENSNSYKKDPRIALGVMKIAKQ